ncbi:MAG: hypothetical protein INR69_20680, partial [Mucilaginibacter polytrichastri]|nr:hypothetical protein [Mucilaginibacter polytrichastri]
MKRPVLLMLVLLFFFMERAGAQVCTGQLGEPAVMIDFGAGAAFTGPPVEAGSTNYTYTTKGEPGPGEYTLERTTPVMGTLWWVTLDRCGGGYMMVVNTSFSKTDYIYQKKLSGLCPNTRYEFSAWFMNLIKESDGNPPDITLLVETAERTFTYDAGILEKTDAALWKQFGFVFTTPKTGGDVTIRIRNNSSGVDPGNDLAIDDIALRPCGPVASAFLADTRRQTRAICTASTEALDLKSSLGEGYTDPQYQWQVSTGNGWQDIAGAVAADASVIYQNKVIGTYTYRLKVCEKGSSFSCGVLSNNVVIDVVDKPNVILASTGPVCPGNTLQLKCNGTGKETFEWTGPNGFRSTDQNPIIYNMSDKMAGIYTVSVTVAGLCSSFGQIAVAVKPAPVVDAGRDVTICEGSGTRLNATGGDTYTWLPMRGTAELKGPSPYVSPVETTLYQVSSSNGACTITDTVKVTVLKKALAKAGADRKVLKGNSVVLQGEINQPGAQYFWSPNIYLDDPTKLNPVCTPAEDIVYTLHVT